MPLHQKGEKLKAGAGSQKKTKVLVMAESVFVEKPKSSEKPKKVKQLNEEQLNEEMEDWGASQFCEWVGRNGTMTHEEVFGYIYQKIKEHFSQTQ